MKKEFEVQSSDGGSTYPVEFSVENEMLHVYCGCPAGALGKWCKHKMRLVSGDSSAVLGNFDSTDMDEVLTWVKKSGYPRLLNEMKLAEDEMQAAKKKMDNAKRALEKAAQKGVAV